MLNFCASRTGGRHILKTRCANCGEYHIVDEHGFCAECSDESSECVICGLSYILSSDYTQEALCPRCNYYYGVFTRIKVLALRKNLWVNLS